MHRMFTDDELVSRIPALLTICDGYIVHVADTGRLSATPLFVCFVCLFATYIFQFSDRPCNGKSVLAV